MNMEEKRLTAFAQAASALPIRFQREALALPPAIRLTCEELRLRAGRPMAYSSMGRETPFGEAPVGAEDLQETLGRATRYSVHSFGESLQNGFVTLEGGHRLGLCGTAIMRDGQVGGIRSLSSVNLRIASQVFGAADGITPGLLQNGRPVSTLILSPPAWGKTTLLRDCIRQLSEGGVRVAVADERCEIAGVSGGAPQFDLGPQTDVLDSAPKADAALLLIKTMSPALLALDEITAPRDVEAVSYAAHCGAAVLATAHALDFADFTRRPLYRRLLESEIFTQVVEISLADGKRCYTRRMLGGDT